MSSCWSDIDVKFIGTIIVHETWMLIQEGNQERNKEWSLSLNISTVWVSFTQEVLKILIYSILKKNLMNFYLDVLNVPECGVTAMWPRPETRIMGGKDSSFGKWPWQVSVRRNSYFGFSSTHRCGGAIINEGWIATAGHCVDE